MTSRFFLENLLPATDDPMPESANQRPRLGDLLISRGLITQEQLDASLAASREAGTALGQVLVESGLVPAHAIAMALADQHGGPLKTEFGFATGGASHHSRSDSAGEAPAVPPVLRLAPTGGAAEPVTPPAVVEGESLRDEIEGLRAQNNAASAARVAAEQALETVRDELTGAIAAAAELRQQLAAERAKNDTAAMAAGTMSVEELRAVIELQEQALAAAAARERARDRDARLVAEPVSARTYSNDRHFLFAAGSEGYELFERSGPPPSPAERVELSSGREYRVVRVGPAPFPGAPEGCAYLELV
ncbi:MAG TPA: hypothetical protein VH210_03975 [Gaiellaceae bacterium]|jgi:hypothetical protein|nr:hypothetical protein [Gaiellaceae bacterium]